MKPLRQGFVFDDGPGLERELSRAITARALFGASVPPPCLGRFELRKVLGRGATGAVYEAIDTERGGRVALKVLSRVDARALVQLKREFRALADVGHPNLVALHELFIEPRTRFFTMELIEGTSFEAWVRTPQRLDEPRLRSALDQLASAVAAMHAAGKLHCDLKPGNVMVTEEGRLVLLDFGLVGELGQTRANGWPNTLVGTPAFMPPEYAEGAQVTAARDWYAIGVMLFLALTGELPFAGPLLDVQRQKRSQDAPDPRALVASLPPDLSELCVRLLCRDPTCRAGWAEVQAALRTNVSRDADASVFVERHFAGRERELSAMGDALEQATRDGRPVCLLLSGASGMGKSRLLERFSELASPHTLILHGRCHQQESLPFKLFDGVVEELARWLRHLPTEQLLALLPANWSALLRLFPVLAQVQGAPADELHGESNPAPRELRAQAFSALKELLFRIAQRQPLVLMVDDLQWGDVDSARMLSRVFSAPQPPALLFLGAHRSEEAQAACLQPLHAAAAAGGLECVRLDVGPLAVETAAELARSLLDAAVEHSDAVAQVIATEAAGVPLFVTELVRAVRAGGAPNLDHEGGRDVSLDQVLLRRIASVGSAATELLQVLSVAAAPLELSIAVAAAGLSEGAAQLSLLRRARLIRTPGSSFEVAETYHDRVRETVVRHMAADALRTTHARIADALEQHGILDTERLIVHYLGASDPIRAGRSAVVAAHAALLKLAFHHAADLFEKAIELLPSAECDERDLRRHLAEALANAGRGASAATAYLAAAQHLPPLPAARMVLCAAAQCWASGRTEQAQALTADVFARAAIAAPAHDVTAGILLGFERVRLRARGLHLTRRAEPVTESQQLRLDAMAELGSRLGLLDPIRGALLQARLLREALTLGDRERSLYALGWELWNTTIMGGPRAANHAARLMPLMASLQQEIDNPYAAAMVHYADAARRFATGREYEECSRVAQLAERIFAQQCPGAFWERSMMASLQLSCMFFTGSLSELATRAGENAKEAEDRQDRTMLVHVASVTSLSSLLRDDPDAALDLLAEQRRWLAPQYTVSRQLWLLWMLLALLYAGRAQAALELARSEWRLFRSSILYRATSLREPFELAIARTALAAYAETGRVEFQALAIKAVGPERRSPTAWGAFRSTLRAALYDAHGHRARAIELLGTTTAVLRARQAPLLTLYSTRYLATLRGDDDGVRNVDAALRAQGVANPERWALAQVPASSQRDKFL